MDAIPYKNLKKGTFVQYWKSGKLTYEDIKNLPLNLQKVARRELRNANIQLPKRIKVKKKVRLDPGRIKFEELVKETYMQVKKILRESEALSDIPYDITEDELKGEIAFAEGKSTTVYVKRDGLSTLTIMLQQEVPTIANLKKAIEVTSRAQHKRELRERYEERLERLKKSQASKVQNDKLVGNNVEGVYAKQQESYHQANEERAKCLETSEDRKAVSSSANVLQAKWKSKAKTSRGMNETLLIATNDNENQQQQEEKFQTKADHVAEVSHVAGIMGDDTTKCLLEPIQSTGELVCSVASNGRAHCPNVSWRFLWRAYSLYNLDSKEPIDDSDGRKSLHELGIENACNLKFNPREKYFGRKRQ